MGKMYLLIAFPALLALHSCKPDKPATPDDNWPKEWYIPQEVLDYFYFNQGSYWVYENDKTSERDTLVLVKNGRGLTNATPQGERYEVAYTELVSKRDGFTYKYGISAQGSAGCIKNGSKWPCYNIDCSKYKIGNYVGVSLYFISPFQDGYSGYAAAPSLNSNFKAINILDSIMVGGNKYSNILNFEITNSVVDNKKNISIYWVKGKGIIKKVNMTDSETWNLVESYVY